MRLVSLKSQLCVALVIALTLSQYDNARVPNRDYNLYDKDRRPVRIASEKLVELESIEKSPRVEFELEHFYPQEHGSKFTVRFVKTADNVEIYYCVSCRLALSHHQIIPLGK
ncbi:hypothetical protein PoB_001137800 [Plakobranchus ocellatus]|uniref:Uncharacterized protein n=1 Tax=Plakobranchus ocellatus TaxID=259542 RepID=A0AAV3YQQ7_9GAST|nr:hypothetical protein PoB_001137800 [Plakobranchus ocellatus]